MNNRIPHQRSTRVCTNGEAKIFEREVLLLTSNNPGSIVTDVIFYTHTKDTAFEKVHFQTRH